MNAPTTTIAGPAPRNPRDLWGVSTGQKKRTRGEAARARRRAKRAARAARVPLKAWLRTKGAARAR